MVYCKFCDTDKLQEDFVKDARNKSGFKNKCKQCQREYNKDYFPKNKERIAKNCKKYYLENRDVIIHRQKEYDKIYFQENKEKINNRRNNQMSQRRKTDSLYKLKCNIKGLIISIMRNKGYSKNTKTYDILGCSFGELKKHIEGLFEDWMTWENHGKYNGSLNHGWDIDHIVPISSANNYNEVITLNHYTNLQPLCSYTNRYIKRDKLNYIK